MNAYTCSELYTEKPYNKGMEMDFEKLLLFKITYTRRSAFYKIASFEIWMSLTESKKL